VKCNFCSTQLRETAKFCPSCGKRHTEMTAAKTPVSDAVAKTEIGPTQAGEQQVMKLWSNLSPTARIGALGTLVLVVVLVFGLANPIKSEAYRIGYQGWNAPVSGFLFTEMKFGGKADLYCRSYGESYYSFTGQDLNDYVQGCKAGFRDANP
jgi:hypothetical protein